MPDASVFCYSPQKIVCVCVGERCVWSMCQIITNMCICCTPLFSKYGLPWGQVEACRPCVSRFQVTDEAYFRELDASIKFFCSMNQVYIVSHFAENKNLKRSQQLYFCYHIFKFWRSHKRRRRQNVGSLVMFGSQNIQDSRLLIPLKLNS